MAGSMCMRRMFVRCGLYNGGYLSALRLPVRVCYYTSHSAGDGASDGSSKNAPSKAQPGSAIRAKKVAAADEQLNKQKTERADHTLDAKLTTAVEEIADALPAEHRSQTRSDLLQKLFEHSESTRSPESATSFTSVLAGMRIDERENTQPVKQSSVAGRLTSRDGESRRRVARPPRERWPRQHQLDASGEIIPGVTGLFEGPSLGIFSAQEQTTKEDESRQKQSTHFDKLEAEDSEHLMTLPPSNAFEEMIRWTEEGKLWKFPIDNEQGMDDEVKTGFYEHVFLEPLLEKRFPETGPVRHFMELVCVGLSKNPYWTVAEKHAHIDWYEEYFKDKLHMMI